MDDLPREEVVETVDRLVAELLQRGGIAEPPVDAIALAQQALGMVICLDKRQPQRGRAQRNSGKPQIYLRPEPTEERHQWTVAHEIGEHMKCTLLERLGLQPEQTRAMSGESLANLFAYRLLLPSCWFADDAVSLNYHVLKLKRRYRTSSHEVIAVRLLDLPDPCVMTIIDNDVVTKRRSSGPRISRKLTEPESKCQRYVHERGRSRRVVEDGWTVCGYPVHKQGWKREILRSTFEE